MQFNDELATPGRAPEFNEHCEEILMEIGDDIDPDRRPEGQRCLGRCLGLGLPSEENRSHCSLAACSWRTVQLQMRAAGRWHSNVT